EDIAHRIDELDMLHIWDIEATPDSTGLDRIMWARVNRATQTRPSVEKVTVDLLALFRRDQGTDRAMVGQLLTMTHGDPMTLGWDWPDLINGVYFAQRIAHKITLDSWTVTLELAPSLHVTGLAGSSDLAGQTWQTAYPSDTAWATPS